jgi:hypothetical protein
MAVTSSSKKNAQLMMKLNTPMKMSVTLPFGAMPLLTIVVTQMEIHKVTAQVLNSVSFGLTMSFRLSILTVNLMTQSLSLELSASTVQTQVRSESQMLHRAHLLFRSKSGTTSMDHTPMNPYPTWLLKPVVTQCQTEPNTKPETSRSVVIWKKYNSLDSSFLNHQSSHKLSLMIITLQWLQECKKL